VKPWFYRWRANGSTTIVTGASSGIGRELCKLLVARNATVIANARRADRLLSLVQETNGRVVPIEGDVSDEAVRHRLIDTANRLGNGSVDLLVNNAGIGAIGPFCSATPQRLRRIMEVNFFAPVELARLAYPLLCKGRAPVLCNISSVLGHRAVPDKSEYCASKFALHGWSDSIRAEWHAAGIQVTLISPSTTW
jgi:NAD(P)-dependent dehydrogenase (short-subunit alcohol dehydrogenase family)